MSVGRFGVVLRGCERAGVYLRRVRVDGPGGALFRQGGKRCAPGASFVSISIDHDHREGRVA